mgnify:CR=1 FL=1
MAEQFDEEAERKELERMRLKTELARVLSSRQELEYKVMEREADTRRMKRHISIQDEKAEELRKLLEATNG